ncbi:M16 family metallopeptidase [Streptomyces sp. NPDC004069]
MTVTTVQDLDLVTRQAPNGLTLTASALRTVPLLQARLALRVPVTDRAELAAMEVLASCWSLHPVGFRLAQAGGLVSVNRTRQWLLLTVQATADTLPLLAETVSALVRAEQPADLIATAVSQAGQRSSLLSAQPAVDAVRRMWTGYYGELPPVADPSATAEEVAGVTPLQLSALQERLRPDHSHLAVVGAVDTARCLDVCEEALAGWHSRDPVPDPVRLTPAAPARPGVVSCRRPGRQQTQIRLVAPAPPRTRVGDFAANQVAAAVLGGGFFSRINTVLREQQGLAYRCRAATDFMDRDFFVIEADVNAARTPRAMSHLHELAEDFATTGPSEDELRAAIGFITGAYTLNLGSQNGRSSLLTAAITQDLPTTALTDVPRAIARLTLDDVREAAASCHPALMSGAVVGDTAGMPDRWFDTALPVPRIQE